MSLSATKIRSLKPSDKSFKLTDSHGLYLRQAWRFTPLVSQISFQSKRIPYNNA